MKRRVSANIRAFRYSVIPAFLIIAAVDAQVFFFDRENADNTARLIDLAFTLVFLYSGFYLYRYLDKSKTIEFDREQLYITGKEGVEVVPFGRVISMQMTLVRLNSRYGWEIRYWDAGGFEKSVRFFPRIGDRYLEKLQHAILNENKDAKVQLRFRGLFNNR